MVRPNLLPIVCSVTVTSYLGGTVFAKNNVAKTPTAKETRQLWETRVKELSSMITSKDKAKDAFDEFLESNKKTYRGDEKEKSRRFSVFHANVKKALNLNVKSDGRAVFGVTKFMDLTEQEFRKFHTNGGKRFSDDDIATMFDGLPEYEIENEKSSPFGFMKNGNALNATTSRDWRKEGVITPVKDQGQCGSCWAFSTVESVEAAARLVDPTTTFIGAPQELVSCDHNMDMGCNGGLPTHAYSYLEKTALESEADYPYTSGASGNSGRCKLNKSLGKWKVTGYTRVAHGMRIFPWTVSRGEKNMKDYMLNKGPMSIGVDATTWQTYQQGVIDAELCSPTTIDHAVQVVALTQEDAKESAGTGAYWTVRNSWTEGWGEDGYIRLSVDENTCLITGMATAPTVEAVTQHRQSAVDSDETVLHI